MMVGKEVGGFTWQNTPTITPEMFEAKKEWCAAFLAAQTELKSAPLNKTNPMFKSKYADLLATWTETIKDVANKSGLFVVQTTTIIAHLDYVNVDTFVVHGATGQCVHARTTIPVELMRRKDDDGVGRVTAHTFASATTYARRISLAAFFGVVGDEDDDGNIATYGVPQSKATAPARAGEDIITVKEQNYLYTTGSKNGYSDDEMKNILKEITGGNSFKTIRRADYQKVYDNLKQKKEQAPDGETK